MDDIVVVESKRKDGDGIEERGVPGWSLPETVVEDVVQEQR
jgi:hypothetical protein